MPPEAKFPSMWEVLGECIPGDHCRQVNSLYYLEQLPEDRELRLLDHGCGAGRLRDWLAAHKPLVRYRGVDIGSSPEVAARPGDAAGRDCFATCDGVGLPYGDAAFDVVNSQNVFEHVRHPEPALAEIRRVLKPGGWFVASVSYLYPYHSYSLFHFTPYGWHTVLTDNGFRVLELRPGIDALASVIRGYRFNHARFAGWFADSPFNAAIERRGRQVGQDTRQINMRKIMNTGVLHSRAIRRD